MGSGAFGIIGTAAGAAIGFGLGGPMGAQKGAQIGATVGSVIDAVTGRSIRNDPRWVGTSYGTPIYRAWGQNRTPGQIIWGLRNGVDGSYLFPANDFKAKLKGTTQHYHASFAIAGPETAFTYADGTQVEHRIVWDRIWMADQIVWQAVDAVPIDAWSSTTNYNFGDPVTVGSTIWISTVDVNLNQFPAGSSLFWKVASDLSAVGIDLTFHPGPSESTFTQAVDSYIATHNGIGNTSAYRGLNYALVQSYDLYFIGNAVPQNISIEWHYAVAPTDEDVLSDICGLCGLSSADVDFTASANALTGFVQKARTSGQEVLNPLLGAKAYDIALIDGLVTAVQRGGAVVRTIPDGDLGAHFVGDAPPSAVEATLLVDPMELHSQLTINYSDQHANFRDAPATAVRNSFSSPNPTSFDSCLTMTPDEAAQMAGRLLDTEWLEAGAEYGISLPGVYADLVPTDPIVFNFLGNATRFRITKYQETHGLVKLRCVRDEPDVLVRFEVGEDGAAAFPATTLVVPTKAMIASTSQDFSDQLAAFPGFNVWVNGAPGWMGAQIIFTFNPPGGSREWIDGPFITTASAFGTAALALGDAPAPGYEATHSVSVQLDIAATMALASSTQTAVNNGTAWALLGSEIIGLVTVLQTSGNTWTLGPGLVRGLRGSPFTGHATNEAFAIAPSVAQTNKVQVDPQYIGQTVYVQCLSIGETVGGAEELSCVIQAPTPVWISSLPTPFQETPAGAINGTNTTFTLSHTPRANSLQLYLNGSPLIPGTDFTLSGSTITTAVAPTLGATVYAFYSY